MTLKELALTKGISLNRLAMKIDVNKQTMYHWNTGKAYPPIDKVIDMSKVLRLRVSTIAKCFGG